MKNLKLFVFALCAVLLSVVTVNALGADCKLPNETSSTKPACQATLGEYRYDDLLSATTAAFRDGGVLNLYVDYGVGATVTPAKNLTINANGHKINITAGGFTVPANVTLTINDANLVTNNVNEPFNVAKNGGLYLNNVTASLFSSLVINAGTTVLTNGKYVSGAVARPELFDNTGVLTLNGTRVDADSYTQTVVKNAGTLTLTNAKVYAAGATLVNIAAHETNTTISNGNYELAAVVTSPSSAPSTTNSRGDGVNQAAAQLTVNGGTFKVTGVAMTLDKGVVATLTNTNVTESVHAVFVKDADVTINSGNYNANDHVVVAQGATKATLTVNGGTFKTTGASAYALRLESDKTTYEVNGGTFESTGVKDQAAILVTLTATVKDGVATVNPAVAKILKGGLYLNSIIARVSANGGVIDVTNQLIADGYTVKDTKKDNKDYKEVVSTKASTETTKPGAPGKEEAPNTFDAGLVYMGLALSAIGASVVSVRKLRNN